MKLRSSFLYSLKSSLPVLFGFFPVGFLYGILMQSNGFNFLWTAACSGIVFAGSLQYLMIDFFTGSASYINVAVMALLLNSRHIFYGLPFIDKWRNYGFLKYLLIFALPDETFSLHIASEISEDMSEKWVYFFNSLCVYVYWQVFTILGALVGSYITFSTEGMDFALTALFAVIVIEQFKSNQSAIPGIIAAVSSLLCLVILGPSYFILPSLFITLFALLIIRPKLEVIYND